MIYLHNLLLYGMWDCLQYFDTVVWETGKACKNFCFKTPRNMAVNVRGCSSTRSTMWERTVLACHVTVLRITITEELKNPQNQGDNWLTLFYLENAIKNFFNGVYVCVWLVL